MLYRNIENPPIEYCVTIKRLKLQVVGSLIISDNKLCLPNIRVRGGGEVNIFASRRQHTFLGTNALPVPNTVENLGICPLKSDWNCVTIRQREVDG